MWFLGLLVGAFIGAIGGGSGMLVGAIVGWAVGLSLSRKREAAEDQSRTDFKAALGELQRRVDALERAASATPAKSPDPIASPAAPAGPAPQAALPAAALEHAPAPRPSVPPGVEALVDAMTAPLEEKTGLATAAPSPLAAPAAARTEPAAAARRPVPEARPARAASSAGGDEAGSLWQRLVQGNIVAKTGVVILFFGVGFLLKFAYDHGMFPVPLRLGAVALAGFGMIVAGYRLHDRRRLYGLILQGGGFGLLYLDVFFALRVFSVLHPAPAFALFTAVGVAMTMGAVRYDAKPLAVLGLTGAFLAPILAGSREGSHVVLFSYYTLLNGFILGVSWFKAWRDLNLVGFLFTFIIGVFWGASNYRPELFGTVEPFVLIFFAMYLVIPILFAQRQPPELKGLVDGMLVFGTPLATAFMQAALVRGMPHGLTASAGCATVLYALLSAMTIRRDGMRLLGETYAALAVMFMTLTIFFGFDAYPTFALWTLEGAAVVWVGLRQERVLARFFGILLQGAGALYFLAHYRAYDLSYPWFNDFIVGCGLIAAAAWLTARLMHKHRSVLLPGSDFAIGAILVWGTVWWFAGGLHALHHGVPRADFLAAALAFAAASFAAAEWLGARLEWPALRLLTTLHLPLLVAGLLYVLDARMTHPFAGYGVAAWPLTFAVYFWCLHRRHRDGVTEFHTGAYRGGWVLMALLATWEVLWQLSRREYAWAFGWSVVGMAVGYLRFHLRERGRPEATAVSAAVLAWSLFFWFVSGLQWIGDEVPKVSVTAAGLGFGAASCLLFELAGRGCGWDALRRSTTLLALAIPLALFVQLSHQSHPFAGLGWLACPAAFAALYWTLYRQEQDGKALLPEAQHIIALWAAVVMLGWELSWQLDAHGFGAAWPRAAWGFVSAAVLAWASVASGGERWPFARHRDVYAGGGTLLLSVFVVAWSLYANLYRPGSNAPLPYVPLLNPIDAAQALALWALVRWNRATAGGADPGSTVTARLAAALGFLWVNCIVLRSIHYWAGVEYTFDTLMKSVLVQSAFSLLWTTTALVLMLVATRRAQRALWMLGALLLGVVVFKLFLNDLSNTGTVARIVSFLGVGALLMVIGYVAPVPPGERERESG